MPCLLAGACKVHGLSAFTWAVNVTLRFSWRRCPNRRNTQRLDNVHPDNITGVHVQQYQLDYCRYREIWALWTCYRIRRVYVLRGHSLTTDSCRTYTVTWEQLQTHYARIVATTLLWSMLSQLRVTCISITLRLRTFVVLHVRTLTLWRASALIPFIPYRHT
jgi:hypothetical protein